jgi:hypothetical protein
LSFGRFDSVLLMLKRFQKFLESSDLNNQFQIIEFFIKHFGALFKHFGQLFVWATVEKQSYFVKKSRFNVLLFRI